MTDISVASASYQSEKRSWYLGTADIPGLSLSGTLDVSAFTPATHYPNGYLLSGIPVSRLASGLWGPFDNTLTAGHGFIFASVKVPNPADITKDVGAGVLVAFAGVRLSKLPLGALSSSDQGKFPQIFFAA